MITTKQQKFLKKFKTNRNFKKRAMWYRLGQRRCHCCGTQLNWTGEYKNSATVEHMVPASKGGTYHMVNTLVVCWLCNTARGDKDWIEWVDSNNMPKKEWLIDKYLESVEFYRGYNRKVHISIFQGVRKYKTRRTTEKKIDMAQHKLVDICSESVYTYNR